MLNGAGVWQKFNTLIMFPRRVAFDSFSSFPFALNEGLCGLLWHVYTVEGAAELNLFARGMKERECGFFLCLMSHNKERSAWKRCVLRNSNTAQLQT